MAQTLTSTFPVFRDAFHNACTHLDAHLTGHAPHSVADVVLGEHGDLIHQTLYTQPALFAIETALFRLLE
ncbi:hypothetical protein, partial [Streptomyces viridochromogenes]|uniref:hypothetical protein n=1 Tax=Streptomyces viridochromogenes TaxID=1938 RepID=UPI0006C6F70C